MSDQKPRIDRAHQLAHAVGIHDETWSAMSIIRDALRPVVDEGTDIDSGGTSGLSYLHPVIGGVEFFVTIRKSRKQVMTETGTLPTDGVNFNEP